MEDGLREETGRRAWGILGKVLILVLMEDGLRERII